MKIRTTCMQCFYEAEGATKGTVYMESPAIELDKWPYMEIECKHGHITRLKLDIELYELLFQQATYCIMDGYYREAIATYNAALERFFEYAIEIMSRKAMPEIEFGVMWKEVSKQSERQLGAYYFLFATQIGATPEFLNRGKVELRNAVVHKGKLATKVEAKDFGEYVFGYIKRAEQQLKEKYNEEIIFLEAMRHFKICEKEYINDHENPIKVVVDGEEQYHGMTTYTVPCFLNMDNVKEYEDCFNEQNYLSYGLLK